ncbi:MULTISPECIES: efflux RND transporter periplasmic adaptor subunit [Halomonas]|uniref:Membrane fusion protein (Multidrug efflux system) n=1 Tax=Halomonas ventosae TaxID=229007 RepID=A0A4V3BZK9_9GAMM|nr:efflux RND transporter periplasmic adaptor subunit [Halomonas ventosae]TDO06919.1 membrane fusion protein (multidrug efflux system) [Halomonas ventosae]
MKMFFRHGRTNLLVFAAALLLAACGQEQAPQQAAGNQEQPPHPVEVTTIARQDIPLDKTYPSLLRSDKEVILVARVTGFLEQRRFEPGQLVEEGQNLYTIEPDLYQAVVNQREADLQSARAELARAQRDAERFERLLSQNSVSRQQYDQALADMRVAQARVAQAEAALASAQIDLDYAEVTAPVSGRISLSRVNVGNLVNPGTELAIITPLDPIEVRFQLPQEDAFALRRQLGEESVETITAVLRVPGEEGSEGESPTLEGRLEFLGSRVDEATSTVQASATFANPGGRVLPGQFVQVSLKGLKRFNVLAVPEIAIGQGLMGPQVFVLDEQNVARARTVELGEVAGPWQIIRGGLEAGERVVVGNLAGIEPGTAIDPQPFNGDAQALMERAMQTGKRQQSAGAPKSADAQRGQADTASGAEAASDKADGGDS